MWLSNELLRLERGDGKFLCFSMVGWSTNLAGGHDQSCDMLSMSMEKQMELIMCFAGGCSIDGLLGA
ncbi:MAG TPA: hypothetical protein DD435_04915 [Cyanobacteria bacterium UBA8530]|nr:hypothetical protein [Cyanobacteria bacterium UBA8530]